MKGPGAAEEGCPVVFVDFAKEPFIESEVEGAALVIGLGLRFKFAADSGAEAFVGARADVGAWTLVGTSVG